MKRLLMLLIIVLLAGCDASVDVVEEPAVVQPDIEDEVIEPEVVEQPPIEEEVVNFVKLDDLEIIKLIFDGESSYVDFRYFGCKDNVTNRSVECTRFDYNHAQTYYFYNRLYFADGDVIPLTQKGSLGERRDDDILQVIFIGELLGVIPKDFRDQIESVKVGETNRVQFTKGILYIPSSYQLEENSFTLRQIFSLFYQEYVRHMELSEIEALISYDISDYYSSSTGEAKLFEVSLWYWLYPVLSHENDKHSEFFSIVDDYYSSNIFNRSILTTEDLSAEMTLPVHFPLYVNSMREFIRRPSDPSALDGIDYEGVVTHTLPDRRREYPEEIDVTTTFHLYKITYIDGTYLDFYVNEEIKEEKVKPLVEEISYFYGQLPTSLRSNFRFFGVHDGFPNIALREYGYTMHLGFYEMGRSNGNMQDFLVHELGHVALDWIQSYHGIWGEKFVQDYNPIDGDRWAQAQLDDGSFITEYAQNVPLMEEMDAGPFMIYIGSEDVADTLVFYLSSRLNADYYHPKLLATWETILENRFKILDELDFSLPPRGQLSN